MERIYFSYISESSGESSDFSFTVPEDEDLRWPDVMEKFTRWLSQVYGYNIKDKVALNLSRMLKDSTWDGQTFDNSGEDWVDFYDWITQREKEDMKADAQMELHFGGTD